MTQLGELHSKHIGRIQNYTDSCLQDCGYDELVIFAGTQSYYFADDRPIPFNATPHFLHWCPVRAPYHTVRIIPGQKPELFFYSPDDFWHEQAALGSPYWASSFEIKVVTRVEDLWGALAGSGRRAWIGPQTAGMESLGFDINPEKLTAMMDWGRSFKSEYEIHCLSQAQRVAATAHQAAKNAFLAGECELGIYYEYIEAINCTDADLPYNAIIALDEKGAYLHYEHKRQKRKGRVLLIDAGARFEAFGSDITRTYVNKQAPDEFVQLLAGAEALQLGLCASIKPGYSVGELHHASHEAIGRLLLDVGIIRDLTVESMIAQDVTRVFYPHGIGHLLGIQVHDVAGQQCDRLGTPAERHPKHPKLRTTRTLEAEMVLTIEPGIYFIGMLLEPMRTHALSQHFNWSLIDKLVPCGGIRIEDDVLVTADGHRNLTREYIPQ